MSAWGWALVIAAGVLVSLLDGPIPLADVVGVPIASAGVVGLLATLQRR